MSHRDFLLLKSLFLRNVLRFHLAKFKNRNICVKSSLYCRNVEKQNTSGGFDEHDVQIVLRNASLKNRDGQCVGAVLGFSIQ